MAPSFHPTESRLWTQLQMAEGRCVRETLLDGISSLKNVKTFGYIAAIVEENYREWSRVKYKMAKAGLNGAGNYRGIKLYSCYVYFEMDGVLLFH